MMLDADGRFKTAWYEPGFTPSLSGAASAARSAQSVTANGVDVTNSALALKDADDPPSNSDRLGAIWSRPRCERARRVDRNGDRDAADYRPLS